MLLPQNLTAPILVDNTTNTNTKTTKRVDPQILNAIDGTSGESFSPLLQQILSSQQNTSVPFTAQSTTLEELPVNIFKNKNLLTTNAANANSNHEILTLLQSTSGQPPVKDQSTFSKENEQKKAKDEAPLIALDVSALLGMNENNINKIGRINQEVASSQDLSLPPKSGRGDTISEILNLNNLKSSSPTNPMNSTSKVQERVLEAILNPESSSLSSQTAGDQLRQILAQTDVQSTNENMTLKELTKNIQQLQNSAVGNEFTWEGVKYKEAGSQPVNVPLSSPSSLTATDVNIKSNEILPENLPLNSNPNSLLGQNLLSANNKNIATREYLKNVDPVDTPTIRLNQQIPAQNSLMGDSVKQGGPRPVTGIGEEAVELNPAFKKISRGISSPTASDFGSREAIVDVSSVKTSAVPQESTTLNKNLVATNMGTITGNSSQIIDKVRNYILGLANNKVPRTMEMSFAHKDLGQVHLQVMYNDAKAIEIQIRPLEAKGHEFFVENRQNLLGQLQQSGLKVDQLKIETHTQDFQFAQSDDGNSQQTFEEKRDYRQMSQEGQEKRQSEKRRQFWSSYFHKDVA